MHEAAWPMLLAHVQRLLRLPNETRTTYPRQCRRTIFPEMQLGACQPQCQVDDSSVAALGLFFTTTGTAERCITIIDSFHRREHRLHGYGVWIWLSVLGGRQSIYPSILWGCLLKIPNSLRDV